MMTFDNELIIEQQELCPYSDFNTKNLMQAARMLNEYYFCLEQTLSRILSFTSKNQKSYNFIKVLIWKKNVAAIRCYFARNIVSELNQMHWDLTPYMIKTLFE